MPNSNDLQGEFVLQNENIPYEAKINLTPETNSENLNLPQEKPADIKTQPDPTTIPTQTPKLTILPDKQGKRSRFFSSFCPYPTNITFQNQDEDEKVILLIRRHFATNIPWMFLGFILLLLPLIILPLTPTIFPFLAISKTLQFSIISFYYLAIFGFALVNFSLWYFNVALVTNEKIIDMDVSGILFRNVAETQLDLIQDISYTQVGAIRSIFNYGNILVQTAGELPNFEFEKAPNPAAIIHILGDLIDKEREDDNN